MRQRPYTPFDIAANRCVYVRVLRCSYAHQTVPPNMRHIAPTGRYIYNGTPPATLSDSKFKFMSSAVTLVVPVRNLRLPGDIRSPLERQHRAIFDARH